jgi:hypothetical protein
MRRYCAVLAASLCAAACAKKPLPIPYPSEDRVREDFHAIPVRAEKGRTQTWIPTLSVPFPGSWPPKGPPEVVYYAYAWNRDGISDGERRAPVWGEYRLSLDGKGPIRFRKLVDAVTEIASQGVWPRMAPAPSWEASEAELSLALAGDLAPEKSKAIKPYYCDWRDTNGVVDRQIGDRQREFFAWLDCPKAVSVRRIR